MSVTDDVARRVIGLPFAVDMDAAAIHRVLDAVPRDCAEGIARRGACATAVAIAVTATFPSALSRRPIADSSGRIRSGRPSPGAL